MFKILVAGGTGLIGSNLITKLKQKNYNVVLLSTQKNKADNHSIFYWQPAKNELPMVALDGVNICINLCGEGIFDKPFSELRKQQLVESRVVPTNVLFEAFKLRNEPLLHYIGGTATGFYSNICEDKMAEDYTNGEGFISELVVDWEKSIQQFKEIAPLVSVMRTGIVLSEKGGFLKQLATPIRYFAGAVPGNGQQIISWIHIDDWSQMLIHLLEKKIAGTFNAVASHPVKLETLTREIAHILHRPLLLPNIPVVALKLIFGERYKLLLTSQNISNDKIKQTGFKFDFELSKMALQNLLTK